MIVDRNQFDKFVAIMPELEKDEVYFVSLSARSKYLNENERHLFALGRTEMFSREIARDKEGLYYAMKKLSASLQYRVTKIGVEIPAKALVVYANINPCSMIKAAQLFFVEASKEINAVTHAYMNDSIPNFEGTKRFNTMFMNCIQRSRSRKYYVDVDIDFFEKKADSAAIVASHISSFLRSQFATWYRISTKSGYHFVVKTPVPDKLYQELDVFKDNVNVKDISFNKNGMIPVPGTLQALELVKFDGGS